jgi:sugar (pentulose or hexulose) kinase
LTAPVLVGLDLGTTNLKGVCFTRAGQSLARVEVQTPRHHPREGWTEWDSFQIWETVIKLLRELLQRLPSGYTPVGISVASVAESVVGIDKNGRPTGPIIAWHDQRSLSEAEWLHSRISEEEVFAITGSPINATFSLCKYNGDDTMILKSYAQLSSTAPRGIIGAKCERRRDMGSSILSHRTWTLCVSLHSTICNAGH